VLSYQKTFDSGFSGALFYKAYHLTKDVQKGGILNAKLNPHAFKNARL